MRFHQWAEIDPAEIVVPLINAETASLKWILVKSLQYCSGKKLTRTQKQATSDLKRTDQILPHIIKGTPISGAATTFYTDASKSGKSG